MCRVLNLTLTFAPLTLLRWQMYAAHGLRSKWHSFMGEGIGEESDDEQDSLKVCNSPFTHFFYVETLYCASVIYSAVTRVRVCTDGIP